MKSATAARPVSDPRAELASRIAAREAAAAVLTTAAEALARARAAVQEAEAVVGNSADLDEQIANAKAQMTKRGESGPLPHDLIEQRNARNAAIEELKECSGALEVLRREHMDAEKALRSATEAASLEAFQVLLRAVAIWMANELTQAKQRVWDLTHRLWALDSFIGLSLLPEKRLGLLTQMQTEYQRVMDALGATEPMHVANSPNEPQAIARRKWKALHTALLTDANASVTWE